MANKWIWCRERIPDHTDFIDCGVETDLTIDGRSICKQHLKEKLKSLRKTKKQELNRIKNLREQIKEITRLLGG